MGDRQQGGARGAASPGSPGDTNAGSCREMEEEPTLVDEADTAAASPGTRSSPRWERSAKNGGSANCVAPGCAVAGGAVFSSLTCAPPCSLSCAVAQLVDGLTSGRVGAGRYHCRRCGRAVCWDCSKRTRHISVWIEKKKPHTVHRTPSAGPLQVCDGCFEAEEQLLVRAPEAETPGRKQALGPEPEQELEPEPEPEQLHRQRRVSPQPLGPIAAARAAIASAISLAS